jgi:hypothetical protein
MGAYLFFDDSNDEQATTLHETGPGEPRALGFLTCHLGSRRFTTDIAWRGVACHHVIVDRASGSPHFFPQ